MHPIRFDYHQKYLSMHPHFVQIHDNSELLINKISAKEMAYDLYKWVDLELLILISTCDPYDWSLFHVHDVQSNEIR